MFDLGKPIKPKEPVEVAEASAPEIYDDYEPLDDEALKEYIRGIFREDVEDSED